MKKLFICLLLLVLTGCITRGTVTVQNVPLTEIDKVYTVPKGTNMSVLLDKNLMNITTIADMKLVYIDYLVGQEEKLNDALFQKVKVEQDKKKQASIFTGIVSIITAIATILGLVLKNKTNKKEEK